MESLSTIYDSIGARVKTSIDEKGMTQADLSKKVHCSNGLISSVINNRKKPSLDVLIRIANALEKPVEYFLTGDTYLLNRPAVLAELNPIIEEMTPSRLKAYIAIGQVMLHEQKEEDKRLQDSLRYLE